jgi:hypothetical protein
VSPDGRPVLIGRLRGRRPRYRKPYLLIDIYCPACQTKHTHGWLGTSDHLDAVTHRAAHCRDGSASRQGGYYLALDPADDARSVRLTRRYNG